MQELLRLTSLRSSTELWDGAGPTENEFMEEKWLQDDSLYGDQEDEGISNKWQSLLSSQVTHFLPGQPTIFNVGSETATIYFSQVTCHFGFSLWGFNKLFAFIFSSSSFPSRRNFKPSFYLQLAVSRPVRTFRVQHQDPVLLSWAVRSVSSALGFSFDLTHSNLLHIEQNSVSQFKLSS